MKSLPLLKFKDEAAYLAPEGLDEIKSLQGPFCPIIFIGDGRSGKSYLASRLLNVDGVFESSDSADPVTEGVDMIMVPTRTLLDPTDTSTPDGGKEDEQLLVLDCEGGNNAMAAIRTLVNVFGIVLGTVVVFVANGMATEQALQNLNASLAARSLIRLDGNSQLPTQDLVFVVNKNTLRYDTSALEKILDQKYADPGRQELRETVRTAFPRRVFFAVPLMGMPDFEPAVGRLRGHLVEARRSLLVGGVSLSGTQLAGLLGLLVSEIRKTNEVSFPSMKRCVIFDGFLAPLVNKLADDVRAALPQLEDYDPELSSRDPREMMVSRFDEASAHLGHEAMLRDEARALLRERLDVLWREVEMTNEAFGNEVFFVAQEEREALVSSKKLPVRQRGLLKKFVVTLQTLNVESRAVVHKKRGGDPECSDWTFTMRTVQRLEESAFESLNKLPIMKGHLFKHSPSVLRSMLRFMNGHQQTRICILKEGHFVWWESEAALTGGSANGCINFFVHCAQIEADAGDPATFTIRPSAQVGGWEMADNCFTGGATRAFHFDASTCEVTRDDWVEAIRQHIEFADLARGQLGSTRLLDSIRIYRPTVADVEGNM